MTLTQVIVEEPHRGTSVSGSDAQMVDADEFRIGPRHDHIATDVTFAAGDRTILPAHPELARRGTVNDVSFRVLYHVRLSDTNRGLGVGPAADDHLSAELQDEELRR